MFSFIKLTMNPAWGQYFASMYCCIFEISFCVICCCLEDETCYLNKNKFTIKQAKLYWQHDIFIWETIKYSHHMLLKEQNKIMIQCYKFSIYRMFLLGCLGVSLSGLYLIWATDIVIKTCQMSIALGFLFLVLLMNSK